MKALTLAALVAVAGCATTAQHGWTKSAKHFTGYPYDIRDDGRRISGYVCGVSIDYSVAQKGDVTRVSGFGAGSVYLEERDHDGVRRLTGVLGGGVGRSELDLVVTSDLVRGRAGLRDVDLAGIGDAFRGQYRVRNMLGSAPMVLEGRDLLSNLPPAELAALLPAMLNCEGPVGQPVVRGPVAVRFGGPAGYETAVANELH